MTFEEAKEYALHQEPRFLPPAKRISGKPSYVCPCCNNGTGSSKTGITMLPGSQRHPAYHCFLCGETGDIFDLAKHYYNLSSNKEAFQAVYSYFGLEIDGSGRLKGFAANRQQKEPEEHLMEEEPVKTDYTEYFKAVHRCLDPTYLETRGISEQAQHHYLIGTDREWINPAAAARYQAEGKDPKKLRPSKRCIIPTSRYSYLARDTREGLSKEQEKYAKQKVGKVPLFNEHFASRCSVIFVAEGELDAVSFYEASGGTIEAAGLGSTSNWSKFVAKCSTGGPFYGKPIVLALDNDGPGRKTSSKMKEELEKKGTLVVEMAYEGKDPNASLQSDRDAFTRAIMEALSQVKEIRERDRETEEVMEM